MSHILSHKNEDANQMHDFFINQNSVGARENACLDGVTTFVILLKKKEDTF